MIMWIQAHVNNVNAGDVVRVKDGSFDKGTGEIHNGRICEVLGTRSGDVIVKSIDDREPELPRTYYPAIVLEKRVEE